MWSWKHIHSWPNWKILLTCPGFFSFPSPSPVLLFAYMPYTNSHPVLKIQKAFHLFRKEGLLLCLERGFVVMYFIFDSFGFFHRCVGKGCWAWPWLSVQRLVSMWGLTSSSECSRIFSETFIRLVGALRLEQNSAVQSKPAYENLKSYLKYNSLPSETKVTFLVLSSPQHSSKAECKGLRKRKICLFLAACDWDGTAGEIRHTRGTNQGRNNVSSIWWLNPSR